MTNTNLLSDELVKEIEDLARAQNRPAADVLADAVHKYIEEQSWVQFVEKNERKARENGIREEDVDRLISEYRRENVEHGR